MAEFRNFQRLSQEFVEVNFRICRLRPVEESLSAQKKTAEAIRQEVAREVDHLLRAVFTVHDTNAILALRCCHLNGRFEDWEARRAA